ncbi:ABC transporter ATP-binding protein [Candidatus Electronema sp. TJ]|uniref:ABC transporter ATP-binding protein n=1 Tax=Candidatus Electronema sp. TJ TaxID=3401573 RepID=UPI003AA83275
MSLSISKLSVIYRTEHTLIHALDEVDLEFAPGTSTALIGESGSGKSTLALACLGLLPDAAIIGGEIRLDGELVDYADPAAVNRLRWFRVAMAFQNGSSALNPVHPVIEQVAEPLLCRTATERAEALSIAAQALSRLGLSEKEQWRYPHQLSGGQVQRALLAMALVLDPDVLMLDEPTSNLDAATKLVVAEAIRETKARGKAVLLITHDLDFAAQHSDRAAVLYSGQLMELLPAAKLLTQPYHPYTMALSRACPDMERTRDLGGIRGESLRRSADLAALPAVLSERNGAALRPLGCLFAGRCTQAVERCSSRQPQLETLEEHNVRCLRRGIVNLLELRGVSKSYKDVQALRPVDLTIRAGEVFALIGETGSGKSTLSMIASGSLKPDSGSRLFDGRDMDEWSRSDRKSLVRRIGLVYQNPAESFSHRFTVFDILTEPLRIHGIVNKVIHIERAHEVLTQVHLPEDEAFLRQYPHQLNMGALQRLSIARALILRPSLLIADEPTSALDPSVQAKVLKLLLHLQTELGLSLLFVTHDLALARKVSDRVGVLFKGELVECGPASAVLKRPAHPYTKFLVSSARGT